MRVWIAGAGYGRGAVLEEKDARISSRRSRHSLAKAASSRRLTARMSAFRSSAGDSGRERNRSKNPISSCRRTYRGLVMVSAVFSTRKVYFEAGAVHGAIRGGVRIALDAGAGAR